MYIFIFKATLMMCAAIYEVDVFLVIYTVNRLFIIIIFYYLLREKKIQNKVLECIITYLLLLINK